MPRTSIVFCVNGMMYECGFHCLEIRFLQWGVTSFKLEVIQNYPLYTIHLSLKKTVFSS